MPSEDRNRHVGDRDPRGQHDYWDRTQAGDQEFSQQDNRDLPRAGAQERYCAQSPGTRSHPLQDDYAGAEPQVSDLTPRQEQEFSKRARQYDDEDWDGPQWHEGRDNRRHDGDRERRRSADHSKNRDGTPSRFLIMVSSFVVVVAVAIGVGAVAIRHRDNSSPLPSKALPVLGAPAAPPKSWHLAFDSDFTGDSLDAKEFGTCYPWATDGHGCTNYGNKDDVEDEWYLASQDTVSDGVVHLVAQRQPTPGASKTGKPEEYQCRSGMITTYPGFQFEYGYVEIVVKVPLGNGLWSALWLAAANQKWPPEVDILEHWHDNTYSDAYLHPLSGTRQGGKVKTPNLSNSYHSFTLKWTSSSLTWYYDGNQVFSTTVGVPHQSMYLIADLADDELTPGSCSGSMDIKSIKVWQP